MASNSSPGNAPPPPSSAPYRLAAVALGIVATAVALWIVGYGFSDYNPAGPSCSLQNAANGTIPDSCTFPFKSLILAVAVFIGGLNYAGRVWSRR